MLPCSTQRGKTTWEKRRTRGQWQGLVEGWPAGGLTEEQHCRDHGISVAGVHRWREHLRRDRAVDALQSGPAEPARLLPVELLAAQRLGANVEGKLQLLLAEGLELEIAPGFDAPTRHRVVALLREPAAA